MIITIENINNIGYIEYLSSYLNFFISMSQNNITNEERAIEQNITTANINNVNDMVIKENQGVIQIDNIDDVINKEDDNYEIKNEKLMYY